MVPKLDDNGDEIKLKIGKRQNGQDGKEQRVLMDTHAEYYITDVDEAKAFIKSFAINADTYDINNIMDNPVQDINKKLPSDKATNLTIV